MSVKLEGVSGEIAAIEDSLLLPTDVEDKLAELRDGETVGHKGRKAFPRKRGPRFDTALSPSGTVGRSDDQS